MEKRTMASRCGLSKRSPSKAARAPDNPRAQEAHCRSYGAMALTKYDITCFSATPALCEEGNSCA